jgi:O-antigen ligase
MIKTSKLSLLLSTLFFASIGFSYFYVEIGFAIKPYMVVALIIFAYMLLAQRRNLKNLSVPNFSNHERVYIIFLIFIGMSFLWSYEPNDSLRFSANVIILLAVYLILRIFYSNFINVESFKKTLVVASCIVIAFSLIYYFVGLVSSGFTFNNSGAVVYGLTMDRGYPRLVGTVSTDPNFAALILSIYSATLFLRKKIYFWKILAIVAVILTFSRGAYLSLIVAFIMYAIAAKVGVRRFLSTLITSAIVLIGVVAVFSYIGNTTDLRVGDVIVERVDDSTADGGSGRVDLWANALNTFTTQPILGIGANASRSYNLKHYNDDHYNHNTYLDVLSELGFVGFIIFTLLILSVLITSVKVLRNTDGLPLLVSLIVLLTVAFLSAMTSEVIMLIVLIVMFYRNTAENRKRYGIRDSNDTNKLKISAGA